MMAEENACPQSCSNMQFQYYEVISSMTNAYADGDAEDNEEESSSEDKVGKVF